MTIYYPQARASLRVLFESFDGALPKSDREYSFDVLPKSVTVSINDYTKADTFKMDLDYRNFPFDPRTIRSVGVVVYIEDLKTYHSDQLGGIKQLEPRAKTAESNKGTGIGTAPTNAVFIGFADEDSIDFDESSRTVTLEGRDYTSLFTDTPYNDPEPIPLTSNITQIINKLLQDREATKGISIVTRGVEASGFPTLAEFYPDFNPLAGKKSRRKNETYWDVIQEIARKAGLIMYIELDVLVISKPNALYERKDLKQFIWGKNLTSLKFARKLGRTKDFNVGVRSLNTRKKEVIEAIIPQDGTKEWSTKSGIPLKKVTVKKLQPDKSIKEEDAKVITFRLPNIIDKAQLVEVGQGIFEEMNRQQIEGSLETSDMCVAEGDSRDGDPGVPFDVTKIRNSTPIDIRLFEADERALKAIAISTSMAKAAKAASLQERIQYLTDKCYEPQVAAAFADALGKFDTPFYTKSVDFTFDMTKGFKMSLDFINFIELNQALISR